jgi:DNA-binding CsgD family transcriptional regulator
VIAANAAARDLDLPITAGALRPAGAVRAQLENALAAAIRPGATPWPPLLMPRADARPWVLDVLPPPPLCRAWVREVHALAVVTDLDAQSQPAAARLCHVFGLTPREADLALLIGGANGLDDAAEQLKITREHARQRLKLVFAKTGVHRQAELVALIARLAEPRRRG